MGARYGGIVRLLPIKRQGEVPVVGIGPPQLVVQHCVGGPQRRNEMLAGGVGGKDRGEKSNQILVREWLEKDGVVDEVLFDALEDLEGVGQLCNFGVVMRRMHVKLPSFLEHTVGLMGQQACAPVGVEPSASR